jgi:hypothetical protein
MGEEKGAGDRRIRWSVPDTLICSQCNGAGGDRLGSCPSCGGVGEVAAACDCCGHQGGTCPRCGRFHSPATVYGCERCDDSDDSDEESA